MTPKFGPAGNSISFKKQGFKSNKDIPKYLKQFSLNAYEYQCGHGVRISEKSAKEFGDLAMKNHITLSVHSPYYISMSSTETEKRENSISYILQTAKIAKAMGAKRIVIHTGSCAKISREKALMLSKHSFQSALEAIEREKLDVTLCPETMGKFNQLGTLEEVLEICQTDERLIPCIDFGHLNARTLGKIKTKEDYRQILDKIENMIGRQRLQIFHSHFSKIAFTPQGGEKKHLTFEDTVYGPEFLPLAELIAEKQLSPTVICESAGMQAEDAAQMKNIYENIKRKE